VAAFGQKYHLSLSPAELIRRAGRPNTFLESAAGMA